MDNPEQNQIFNQLHSKNREEDEMRYNYAKEAVRETVDKTGAITLDRVYSPRKSARFDVEMRSVNEQEEVSNGESLFVQADNIDDLMYKMALAGKSGPVSKQPSGYAQNSGRRSPKRQTASNFTKSEQVQPMSDF